MRPIRLLVVDDYAPYRQLLAGILGNQHGFEVVGQAENGLEAIKQTRVLRPDLILMDMNMPRCDGLEATECIVKEFPNVAIVILTSAPEDTRVLESMFKGAQGFLTKSTKIAELPSSLHHLIDSRTEIKYHKGYKGYKAGSGGQRRYPM